VIGGAMIVVALPVLLWGAVTMQTRMFMIVNPEVAVVVALGVIALGVIVIVFARRELGQRPGSLN
jgi:hypothetical protein